MVVALANGELEDLLKRVTKDADALSKLSKPRTAGSSSTEEEEADHNDNNTDVAS